MVRIPGQAFGRFWPGSAAVGLGRQSCERLASRRDVRGHPEGLQLRLQMVMGLVVRLLHGRGFEGAGHPCHLAIRPRRVGGGPPRGAVRRLADASNALLNGVESALAVGAWATVLRPHGVQRVGHHGQHLPADLSRHLCMGVGLARGRRQLTGPGTGDTAGELTGCRADRGEVDRAGAAGL